MTVQNPGVKAVRNPYGDLTRPRMHTCFDSFPIEGRESVNRVGGCSGINTSKRVDNVQ